MIPELLLIVPAAQAPIEPCATEDQTTRCVWDARHMGNGEGSSFLVKGTRHGETVRVTVTHKRAHNIINDKEI